MSVKDRFDKFVPQGPGCLEWRGGLKTGGYGHMRVNGPRKQAHRLAYELYVGPIQQGFQIDHLCRNHVCVNVQHLEAVPQRINVLRGDGIAATNAVKTHCDNGHPFTAENTYIRPGSNDNRDCRQCTRDRGARYRQKKRTEQEDEYA